MTNTQLLVDKISESGLKRSHIAEKLNLSLYGFANKVNNVTEFKAGEIQALCRILKITSLQEKDAIFFADCGEFNSTGKEKA